MNSQDNDPGQSGSATLNGVRAKDALNGKTTTHLRGPQPPHRHNGDATTTHALNGDHAHTNGDHAHGERLGKKSALENNYPGVSEEEAEERWKGGLDWPVVIWIVLVHALALGAPFFFSWQALAVCAALILLTGSGGVCMGYHRCLTHRSFKTYRPIRWLLAFLGGLSGEGSALTWVANHRKHHVFSDKHGDPHSPRDGKWWSHMMWFMPNFGRKWHMDLVKKYAPDIEKDKVMRVLHHLFLPSHVALGLALFFVGYFGTALGLGGWEKGLGLVFWGLGVRMVYVLHVTWFVNSATHLWGTRRYDTSDDSRNLWWVGLLAFGEGWHNNHHAYQNVASQGHAWWEIDTTYYLIWLMEKTGLAWDVVRLKDIPHGTKPA